MYKILIVDDDIILGLELKEYLSTIGYQAIKLATSGSEAIKLARKHEPDPILMDIKLLASLNLS